IEATIRALVASSSGSSSASHASAPGFWRPTLFSIPPSVSWRRGAALPAHGSADSDLTTTAPNDDRSRYAPSSAPCPAVPDAVITGLGNSTEPTVAAMSTACRGVPLRLLTTRALRSPPALSQVQPQLVALVPLLQRADVEAVLGP